MNKVQFEFEQKKEYTAPQMEIVELKHQTSVLTYSNGGAN